MVRQSLSPGEYREETATESQWEAGERSQLWTVESQVSQAMSRVLEAQHSQRPNQCCKDDRRSGRD